MSVDHLNGWLGADKGLLKEAFDSLPDSFKQPFTLFGKEPFRTYPQGVRRTMLFEVNRKILGKDTENYGQEIGDCHDVNTFVLMSSGKWKRISEIEPGEYVVSHLNRHKKVTRTIKKKYSGRMYTMKAKGHYTNIRSTADHEYLVFQDDDPKACEWKSISSVNIDTDSILVPFAFNEVEYESLYYYGNKIKVDEDAAYIFGWYLAEGGLSNEILKDGHISYQKVTFNLCIDEEDIADELTEKLRKIFGIEAKKQYSKLDQNVLLLEVYDVDFSNFIHKLVPDNLYGKKIPPVFLRSPKNVKMALLKAWIGGDGFLTPSSASGCSSSHDLIRDFFHLSISCKLNPKAFYRPQQEHQNVSAGIVEFRNNSFRELVGRELTDRDYLCQKNVRARYVRNNNLGQLREIEYLTREEVEDVDVYCLEVEDDHSFIANGYAVHNCTSFGAKNVTEYLSIFEMAMGGAFEFKNIFPPFFYGASRILVGGGGIWGDGSLGSWTATAAQKYGVLFNDQAPGVYSGSIAKSWGRTGPPQQYVDKAKSYPVKTIAQIKTWEDACTAIENGYPIAICSNIGFDMQQRSDGFMHYSTRWDHCMALIGFDEGDSSVPAHGCILNSWGDMFGKITDFRDKSMTWPVGTLRVTKGDVERILSQEDSWAYSSFDAFPARALDPSFFSSFS